MSTPWVASIIVVVAAYLLGSLAFAIIVTKLFGDKDPRTYGSKNPGFTNVLRSGNKAAAVITLLLDALKGWLAVYLAAAFMPQIGYGYGTVAAAGVAAFVGHLWPVFFKFQGGKGVATALGVLLAMNVWMGLASALTWAIIAFFFRYSSLASIAAAVFAVFYWAVNFGFNVGALAVLVMAALLIWRHKQNINNLLEGKERKLGHKS
jgi:acyl phosphate:glycerol-3-phosphate acyltransferase